MTRKLGWLAVAIIPPAAVGVAGWNLGARHPVVAGTLLILYECLLVLLAFTKDIAGELRNRWRDSIVDSLDQASRRLVSGFGRRYREFVLSSLRFIDLKGLATVGFYTPQLDEVFVDVGLIFRAPHQVAGGLLADLPSDVTDRHWIGDFLGRRQAVVLAVIGSPGSGKTTLLRHTARQVCRGRLGRRRTLPVLLYLRDHVNEIITEPEITLPEVLRGTLRKYCPEPAGWFERRLREGECVVLLDGLDEVARQSDRRAVADWVEAQIRQYSKNDFVITSRPHGYRTADIAGATVLQVRSFTNEQVNRYVRDWYLAVERHSMDAASDDVSRHAEAAAEDLLERLNATPGLYDLTVNPLLLTMIANVHRYRGALPNSRVDLYGEICQVMLWRRQEAKKLPVGLDGHLQEALLRGLAFVMMRRRVRDLPRAAVLAEIKPSLRRMSTKLTAEEFLVVIGSNGLLVEREVGQYSFAHQTFQEYLAAAYIREKGRQRVLVEAVDDVWWREATLLYAARSDNDPIVHACLSSASVCALSLAFDCVEQGSQLAPELRAQLDRLLGSAFDPRTDAERRRLMTGVLIARHLAHLISTGDGGRVCARPITANLYWLYQQDVRESTVDSPVAGTDGVDTPVTGVVGSDALAFAHWANRITGQEPLYRLPNRAEITHDAVRRVVDRRCVWLNPTDGHGWSELWIPAGSDHPHTIDTGTLADHITRDVNRSVSTFMRLLLIRSVIAVRTLGQSLDRVPTLTLALDHALDQAFDLSRTLVHVQAVNSHPDLDVAPALDLVHDLDDALNHARHDLERPRKLVRAVDEMLNHLLRQSPARLLDQVLNLDVALQQALLLAHSDDFDVLLDKTFDQALDRVMGSALAQALVPVLRQPTPSANWATEFSAAFVKETCVLKSTCTVAPDSLVEKISEGTKALLALAGPSTWALQVSRKLAEIGLPVAGRQEPLTAPAASAIRITALCLAAEATTHDAVSVSTLFREIAAGVTLLERRANGEAPMNETILLATA